MLDKEQGLEPGLVGENCCCASTTTASLANLERDQNEANTGRQTTMALNVLFCELPLCELLH